MRSLFFARLSGGFSGLLTVLWLALGLAPVKADSLDEFGLHKATGEAKLASGTGNLLFLAVGTFSPLTGSGPDRTQHTLRTVDSLLTSTLFTEGLKRIAHEKRPDGSSYGSFPSGHATAAFAAATMQAHYHPSQSLLWYGGATLIGASRVQLKRHYWHDVLAGAAVGYFTSRLELHQSRGLLLFPLIHDTHENRGPGISFSASF